jgi:hypothetical protein
MTAEIFEALVRRAPAMASRRSSLVMLGVAPLVATLTGATSAQARRDGRNERKKKKHRPAQNRPRPLPPISRPLPVNNCAELTANCIASLRDYCSDLSNPEDCDLPRCCRHLETCDSSTFFTCLTTELTRLPAHLV